MKIIIDTNLWVSFTIGKRPALLSDIVRSEATVVIRREIGNGYLAVGHRPGFSRCITEKDIEAARMWTDTYCELPLAGPRASWPVRDANDLFPLSLAYSGGAGCLLAGDTNLLVPERHHRTRTIDTTPCVSLTKRERGGVRSRFFLLPSCFSFLFEKTLGRPSVQRVSFSGARPRLFRPLGLSRVAA